MRRISAGEAVDAKVALDAAGWIDVDKADALGVKLANEVTHKRDQIITVLLDTIWGRKVHNFTLERKKSRAFDQAQCFRVGVVTRYENLVIKGRAGSFSLSASLAGRDRLLGYRVAF
jgi:hypothetical protein